jgi:hypothetical protein
MHSLVSLLVRYNPVEASQCRHCMVVSDTARLDQTRLEGISHGAVAVVGFMVVLSL